MPFFRFTETMQMLTEDVVSAKKLYHDDSGEFRQRELDIRRQKWRLEDQLDGFVRKMDDKLYILSDEYYTTNEQFKKETKAYNALYSKFEVNGPFAEVLEAKLLIIYSLITELLTVFK